MSGRHIGSLRILTKEGSAQAVTQQQYTNAQSNAWFSFSKELSLTSSTKVRSFFWLSLGLWSNLNRWINVHKTTLSLQWIDIHTMTLLVSFLLLNKMYLYAKKQENFSGKSVLLEKVHLVTYTKKQIFYG